MSDEWKNYAGDSAGAVYRAFPKMTSSNHLAGAWQANHQKDDFLIGPVF